MLGRLDLQVGALAVVAPFAADALWVACQCEWGFMGAEDFEGVLAVAEMGDSQPLAHAVGDLLPITRPVTARRGLQQWQGGCGEFEFG